MKKIVNIALASIPILLMMGLIPLVGNDYVLMSLFIFIIIVSFSVKYDQYDLTAFAVGFVLMTIAEYLFIKTGVEIFVRNSLFGVMPIWLPFLWGYGLVAMKRIVQIIIAKQR